MFKLNKIKNAYLKSFIWRCLTVFLLTIILLAWIQNSPTLVDPDGFYHLKMARLIADNGVIIDFPWTQFTTLKNYFTDQHLVYHLLLIPFLKVLPDLVAIKTLTVVLSSLFIVIFFYILYQEKVVWPELFILLLLSNTPFLFRINLPKASSLALIILFLGLWFIWRKKVVGLFLVSFIYTFSHGGFLLLLFLAIFYFISEFFEEYYIQSHQGFDRFLKKTCIWRYKVKFFFKKLFSKDKFVPIFIVCSGLLVGLLASPYFPQNFHFLKEQVFDVGLFSKISLIRLGGEWHPYSALDFFRLNVLVLGTYLSLIAVFIVNFSKQNKKTIFLFLTSVFFLLFSIKSKRFFEYFIPFAVMFSTLEFSLFKKTVQQFFQKQKKVYIGLGVILLGVVLVFFMSWKNVVEIYRQGQVIDQYRGVSEWLKSHTDYRDLVFHSDWDDFPALFYHNTYNYYLVGLDPTFMYNYNPQLYFLYEAVTSGQKKDKLKSIIFGQFKSKYVIVNQDFDEFKLNLFSDNNFVKVYEDDDAIIFKIDDKISNNLQQ